MYQPLVPSGIDWFVGVALSNDDDDDVDNDNDDDDNDVNVERTPSCKEVTTLSSADAESTNFVTLFLRRHSSISGMKD